MGIARRLRRQKARQKAINESQQAAPKLDKQERRVLISALAAKKQGLTGTLKDMKRKQIEGMHQALDQRYAKLTAAERAEKIKTAIEEYDGHQGYQALMEALDISRDELIGVFEAHR